MGNNNGSRSSKQRGRLAALVWTLVVAVAFWWQIFRKPLAMELKILCAALLVGVFFAIYFSEEKKYRHLGTFRYYTENYQLSAEELSAITGFSKHDFSQDSKGRMVFLYLSSKKKRQRVFQRLEERYGKAAVK